MSLLEIIGIAGRAYVGKSTLARHIVETHQYNETALAAPIKAAAQAMFGLRDGHVSTQQGKGWTHPTLGIDVRAILQRLGTDCIRKSFGDDVWCRLWEWRVKRDQISGIFNRHVVSDLRFANEVRFFRQIGARIVLLTRDTGIDYQHPSENGLDYDNQQEWADCVIRNDGSIGDLCAAFDAWLRSLPD